jgi:signal transduction histidine kinase
LHEGLQQKLLGARILLNQHTADHQTNKNDSDHEDLEEGIVLLNTVIQITRTLSLELNPPILNTEGLDAALRWLCKHMQDNYKLNIDLQMHGSVDHIRGEAQMLLTNMIRELLSNVVRHSGEPDAEVTVICEYKHIKIIVRDNGIGFDVETLSKKTPEETRFGLFSVRERLSLFGGQLQIESQNKHGTTCTIIYPYSNC